MTTRSLRRGLLGLLVVAGCGGGEIVDEPGPSNGGDGSGGTPTTTMNGGAGGVASGGGGADGGSPSNGGAGGMAEGGSGGTNMTCAGMATCELCLTCSITTGDCADENATCLGSNQCAPYATCITACALGDAACKDACDQANPGGANQYGNVTDCTICGECAVPCEAFAGGC